MKKPLSLLLCLLLVFHSGCVAWKPFPTKKNAAVQALPEIYQHYYDYPELPLKGEIISEERKKGFITRRVEIPLNLPDDLVRKDLEEFKKQVAKIAETDKKTADDLKLTYTTRIDYYIPAKLKPGQKRPVILISSILGGTMVVDFFARYYARHGYVAALVHRKRLSWDEKQDIEQVEDYLRISLIRLRQAVDWLQTQPEVAPNRIGAFGISYGAVLHSMLAAVDMRVKYHVLAMPAGELADTIMECPDKAITKVLRKIHEERGWSREEIHTKLERTIVTDPIYLAPYAPKNRIQVYAALFDRVVGAGRSFRLWKKLRKPELRILPFGHYGGILLLPYLEAASLRSFKKHLK